MNLPITKELIDGLGDLGCYTCRDYDSRYRFIGEFDKDSYRIEDGILYPLDERGSVVGRINSLTIENNIVRLEGEYLAGLNMRCIVAKSKTLADFGICISSNIRYYRKTIPKILKSIRNVGFDGRIVVVVVDDSLNAAGRAGEINEIGGEHIEMIHSGIDKYGYSSLLSVDGSHDYWLSLHDTCELTSDFGNRVVDVSLNPDYILLASNVDIGFYSYRFIDRVRDVIVENSPSKIRGALMRESNVWIDGDSPKKIGNKDIYGTGNNRDILLTGYGVKKYIQGKQSSAVI